MKKPMVFFGVIILIILVVFIGYLLINSGHKKNSSNDGYLTMSELEAFCGLDQKTYSCDESIPCEGKIVSVKGYSLGDSAFPRRGYGLAGLKEVYSNSVGLVEFTETPPKNSVEYYKIRDNYFGIGVSVIDVKDQNESEQIKQNIEKIQGVNKEEADLTPIKVYVKNATIVVYDMPDMNSCIRGIGLEAKKADLNFFKVE